MTARNGVAPVAIRAATDGDAPVVAALHAASWRAHYRGAYSDDYLDGPVDAERLAVWTRRLRLAPADMVVRVAECDGALLGFVCLFVDQHPIYGSLVDNLHVAVDRKGRGIGRALMHEAGRVLRDRVPARPAHLFVLESNAAARAFYDRIGGRPDGSETHPGPDGSMSPVLRYGWRDAAALLDGTRGADAP